MITMLGFSSIARLGVSGGFLQHTTTTTTRRVMTMSTATSSSSSSTQKKGKLLVLGGTGFLGQMVCKRAVLEGFAVTSLSRRGVIPESSVGSSDTNAVSTAIDYRMGDARKSDTVKTILSEGGYTGIIHCIGLLFDQTSGLSDYNRFVSGSASVPDKESTYDTITRQTAFFAIDAAIEHAQQQNKTDFPFLFTSAAEAGWPDMAGGDVIEQYLAPDWLKRYLQAKREVEKKLMASTPTLRPIIVRPSLIYSLDRPSSYVPVGAFFVGNKIGLPFVDRPVTVQALSSAMIRSMNDTNVRGVQRYQEIDKLSQ
jgi:nucleoside-diphosphate-sugar epimerase